jgi:phosphoglycerate dehydrogenase-like enzyme
MFPPLVVVTEPEYRRGEAVFASSEGFRCVPVQPGEDVLAAAIRDQGALHAIVGSTTYRDAIYRTLPRGSVLARYGVGHENVDKAKATECGLLCTNTPGVLDQSVAEVTIGLIVSAARHITSMAGAMRSGVWKPVPGIELEGRTVAVIGTGPIGRAVGRAARRGFGMRAIGCGRGAAVGTPIPTGDDFDRTTRDFDEAVATADFVSLHIPGVPENHQFIDAARLARMKTSAWLVNTARGAVVDEAALYEALSQGRLAGAALDVFAKEPYEPADPSRDLRTLPNVIALPHVGSNTAEANRRMAERALGNVRLGHARDYTRMDLLNPEVVELLGSR